MIKKIKTLWKALKYRYQSSGIQFMISLSFTIIIIFSMTFSGMLMYIRFNSGTEMLILKNNEQLMNQVSLNLEGYVRNMMRISDSMYYNVIKNVDLMSGNLDSEMALLYEANKDDVVSIACYEDGRELVGAAPIANMKTNVDISRQDWYQRAYDKIENMHFSIPHVQNLFEENTSRYNWVISLSRVVELTKGGDISRGVLLVDMNYSGIEEMFKKINDEEFGYVYLIDRHGEFIYHPRQKAIYAGQCSENNLQAAEYEDGSHTESFLGEKRIVTVKTVGYTGWKIVSVIPTDEFYLNLNRMRFFLIAVIVATLLFAVLMNLLVSERIANPIRRLDESVRGLESGDFTLDIYEGGSREIRHLGTTIRSMVKQMQKLMNDIVEEQESKRKSELDALQSQINPHFLYNALDAIVWMVEEGEYKNAISTVTALASLFRISLSKGKTIISIRDEIQHAKNYMDIQMIRFEDEFAFQMEVEPEILECSTIKLILQPILENAIYYGVEPMGGDGEIKLHAYEKGGDIYIDITDNGLGMPEETVKYLLTDSNKVHKKGSGVGLVNVDQRIRLYFGEHYGLEIQSAPDEGTTVRVHLPRSHIREESINKNE